MIEIIQTLLFLAGIIFLGMIACILGAIQDELQKMRQADSEARAYFSNLPDDDEVFDKFDVLADRK